VALCCDLPFAFAVGTPDFAMVLPNVRRFAAVAQVSFSVTLFSQSGLCNKKSQQSGYLRSNNRRPESERDKAAWILLCDWRSSSVLQVTRALGLHRKFLRV